jgi:hypothetical protein
MKYPIQIPTKTTILRKSCENLVWYQSATDATRIVAVMNGASRAEAATASAAFRLLSEKTDISSLGECANRP